MYSVSLEKTAQKDFRRFDKPLKEKTLESLSKIASNPSSGEPLKGSLSVYRSYHFSYQGKQYRIAYVIYEGLNTVVVIMIGPREKFYERLKPRVANR